MKKVFIVTWLLIMVFLSACAETPKEDVVVGKNDGVMEEIIDSTTQADASDHEIDPKLFSSFESADGSVHFDFDDSDLILPEKDSLPVIQVTPYYWTSADARRITEALFPECEIHEFSYSLTRQQIEQRIIQLKQWLDPDAMFERYQGDEKTMQEVREMFEQQIIDLEKLYAETTENTEPVPCDYQFHSSDYYARSYGSLVGDDPAISAMMAQTVYQGMPYLIQFSVRNDNSYRLSSFMISPNDPVDQKDDAFYWQTVPFDEESIRQGLEIAENAIADMGFSGWTLNTYTVDEAKFDGMMHYRLVTTWRPEYGGVPVVSIPQIETVKSDDVYASNYFYESLRIDISNQRIHAVIYGSPLDVVEVINENVQILPQEEMKSRINQQLELTYTTQMLEHTFFDIDYETINIEAGIDKVSVIVSSIELGLVRIQIQGNESDFYFVPSWVIKGNPFVTEYHIGKAVMKKEPSTEWIDMDQVLLCINAIDGSVIDVSKGY